VARARSEYVCRECGYRTPRPLGRCPECDAWDTFDAVAQRPTAQVAAHPTLVNFGAHAPARALRLEDIDAQGFARLPVPIEEFARVLGGGIVQGSLVLIGGDPGVGKSTLLTQVADAVAETAGPVLYISGEESLAQVGLRSRRMGTGGTGVLFASETSLEAILELIQAHGARLAVIDSIQSVMAADVEALPGTVSQLRECTLRLLQLAKTQGVALFLIGHVTKEGAIAGPKVLEHMVDAVLYLEGERFNAYRLLRSTKNRFGPTHEVGVFEMQGSGLVEVPNPSAVFLAERGEPAPGSVVTVTLEGTRPILVEVQALASRSTLAVPRRTANGLDTNRLHLIAAVLARRLSLPLHDQDVYLNVVGGLRIDEPAADLAALAIISSVRDRSLAGDLVALGEIGLSGELRSVGQLEQRLREAAKLGFNRALVPRTPGAKSLLDLAGLEVLTVSTLREATRVLGL
jgi:DNA repair protein RadA/Sms